MRIKRIEQIIKDIRRRSNNEDYGPGSGISDDAIVSILNGAKDKLQALILEAHATSFRNEILVDLVAGQEVYDLPDDMLDPGGIVMVEYKLEADQWVTLKQLDLQERSQGENGRPWGYIRDGRKLLLRPLPQATEAGWLRVTYVQRLNDLGIRLGRITVSTIVDGEITVLIKNVSSNEDTAEIENDILSLTDTISVVDRDGLILNGNIQIDGYDADTGEFLLYGVNEQETNLVDGFVISGFNSSTHLDKVDPIFVEYLIQYGADYLNMMDSNGDVQITSVKLKSLENMIVDMYERETQDIILVPDTNTRGY